MWLVPAVAKSSSSRFWTALQPTKRMCRTAENAEGKRACVLRRVGLSAHSITRSPMRGRAVGYTVASASGWAARVSFRRGAGWQRPGASAKVIDGFVKRRESETAIKW